MNQNFDPRRRQLNNWLLGACLFRSLTTDAQAQTPTPRPLTLLLANTDGPRIDPALYLVSEKYDGVRAVWDGSTLRFRSGRPVPAPAWFIQQLPAQALDGELWITRGQFDTLSGIVRSEIPADEAWKRVTYLVFDLPDAPGSFADRAALIAGLVNRLGGHPLQAVEQQRVPDRAALTQLLDDTVRSGGEGLMLHLASAPYVTGRSDVLIKLKRQLDAEATVVSHRPGQGKYLGMLGALEVETPEGRRFLIGTGFSDAQRREPPALGTAITYRYRDLTSGGLPRFASFLRTRDNF